MSSSNISKIARRGFKVYELISTAYHESGHVIFALLHQMEVEEVSIFEHKTLKRIHGETVYQPQELTKDSINFNARLEREIGFSYAGLLAEKHLFAITSGSSQLPSFIKEGSSNDLSFIRSLLQKYDTVPAGKKRYRYKQELAKQTLLILVQNWEAVSLVAHALVKHKKLSSQDLKKILTKKTSNKQFWKNLFKNIYT